MGGDRPRRRPPRRRRLVTSLAIAAAAARSLAARSPVCVDRPLLTLDRPFTYDLPAELGAGVGSLVQVPFHGRSVRGWVLGPDRRRAARMLPVRTLVSPVRWFDERRSRAVPLGERALRRAAGRGARRARPRLASRARRIRLVSRRRDRSPCRLRSTTCSVLIATDDAWSAAIEDARAEAPGCSARRPSTRSSPSSRRWPRVSRAGRRALVIVPEGDPRARHRSRHRRGVRRPGRAAARRIEAGAVPDMARRAGGPLRRRRGHTPERLRARAASWA